MAYISPAHHRKCLGWPVSVRPTVENTWNGPSYQSSPPKEMCQSVVSTMEDTYYWLASFTNAVLIEQ